MQEKRQGYQTVLFEHTRLTLTCSNLYTSAKLSIAEKSWEAWEHNADEQHTPAIRRSRCIAPIADYADEQHNLAIRRGRFIAPSADLSALAGCSGICMIWCKVIILLQRNKICLTSVIPML
jgi:hypothetical protein